LPTTAKADSYFLFLWERGLHALSMCEQFLAIRFACGLPDGEAVLAERDRADLQSEAV